MRVIPRNNEIKSSQTFIILQFNKIKLSFHFYYFFGEVDGNSLYFTYFYSFPLRVYKRKATKTCPLHPIKYVPPFAHAGWLSGEVGPDLTQAENEYTS